MTVREPAEQRAGPAAGQAGARDAAEDAPAVVRGTWLSRFTRVAGSLARPAALATRGLRKAPSGPAKTPGTWKARLGLRSRLWGTAIAQEGPPEPDALVQARANRDGRSGPREAVQKRQPDHEAPRPAPVRGAPAPPASAASAPVAKAASAQVNGPLEASALLDALRKLRGEEGRTSGQPEQESSPRPGSDARTHREDVDFVTLTDRRPEAAALALIPEGLARKYAALPFAIQQDRLVVVMASPDDQQAVKVLSARAQMKVLPAAGLREEILGAIEMYYTSTVSDDLIKLAATEFGNRSQARRKSHTIPLYRTEELDAPDAAADREEPVVELVDSLIARAVRLRASDIHIAPQEDEIRVRCRIDGHLQELISLPLSIHAPLLSRLKIIAGMNIAEKRRPQDGQFAIHVADKDIDVRVASSDTIYGEMMVLRLLDRSLALYALTELGFEKKALELYRKMLRIPHGMILISGPTGAGKTTTLYSSINEIDRKERNIITVEDPVEYRFPGVSSIQVNEKAGLTFATALRSILRLDPDLILVGEIRDPETARIALQAALTGHLVLSSIHANEAVKAIHRLADLGVEPFLINSAVAGVVAQRMVRKVCSHCQVPYEPSEFEQRFFDFQLGKGGVPLVRGKGCSLCTNTGFHGRTGIFEVILVSEGMRSAISSGADYQQLREQASKDGMLAMKADGLLKINSQVTTPVEVMKQLHTVDAIANEGPSL